LLFQIIITIRSKSNNGDNNNNNNNHERIRTLEQIISSDKGGMIISPRVELHENVVALDYDSEFANLIVWSSQIIT
jgi:DNA polymerase elongation subunit (family B)